MKIAVTASGPELSSPMDMRFGRAKYLLVVDTSDHSVKAVDNRAGMNAEQGAGIQAAQAVIDTGAEALVTGHCGPKAFRALQAAKIPVFLTQATTVEEAVAAFEDGSLNEIAAADVESHW